ncbi:molybdopterin dehydrogenase [Subtercola sp. Z020]|uniref:FAD binding domain-containing protein n=1 Tax=Subtercola sp. Z020 TaxID=2080582 RepID=UPI000CE90BA9|nr:xanthine dehydrogenase family protein subunit M [Subtercola sp. Z020]PPF85642.1 molybdopterin dehydrogenase [Subtercola sp. Z020]
MKPFGYERPVDLAAAVTLLAERPDARVLAGGTNLVDLMRLGVERPGLLIDVNRLGMDGIEPMAGGGIRIGAGVRNSDLAGDIGVRTAFPLLAEAVLAGASGQLRNMASVGGNLLQRTRCLYFADTSKPCNKREPGSGCSALAGSSRELAVLGASESCIATFPGDMAVALSALGARVEFQTERGEHVVDIDDFYRDPGDHPELDTTLPPGAIITAVHVPGLPVSARSTYRKARDRRSFAFGLVTVAAALEVDDGIVQGVRLALGGVAHRPWRARRAEAELVGRPVAVAAIERAIDAELSEARPTPENAFKVPLVRRLVTGTLLRLAAEDGR